MIDYGVTIGGHIFSLFLVQVARKMGYAAIFSLDRGNYASTMVQKSLEETDGWSGTGTGSPRTSSVPQTCWCSGSRV